MPCPAAGVWAWRQKPCSLAVDVVLAQSHLLNVGAAPRLGDGALAAETMLTCACAMVMTSPVPVRTGPWTSNPLKFDNEYFKFLLEREWVKKDYAGNEMFEDKVGTPFSHTTVAA